MASDNNSHHLPTGIGLSSFLHDNKIIEIAYKAHSFVITDSAISNTADKVIDHHAFLSGGCLTEHDLPPQYTPINSEHPTGRMDGTGASTEATSTSTMSSSNNPIYSEPFTNSNIELNGGNMAGVTPPLEAQELEGAYPLLPDMASTEYYASILFIKNPHPGKEIFTGRAVFPAGNKSTESFKTDSSRSYQGSSLGSAISRHPGPARKLQFPKDSEISLMSRGFAKLSIAAEDKVPKNVVQGHDSFDSLADQGDAPATSKYRSQSPGTPSYRNYNVEHALLLEWSRIRVYFMDLENTVVALNGDDYDIPNNEFWLVPPQNKGFIVGCFNINQIEPQFFTNLRNMGPQKAIESVKGHRRASSTSLRSEHGALDTQNEGQPVMLTPSPRAHSLTASSEGESHKGRECLVATTNILVLSMKWPNTIVELADKQYAIPSHELWILEEDILLGDSIFVQVPHPLFVANYWRHGPLKAIEAANGYRVPIYRDGTGLFSLSLGTPNLKATECSEEVSSDAGSYSNTVTGIPAYSNFGPGSVDGTGSVERFSARIYSPILFTGSPATLTRAGSQEGSFRSLKTYLTTGAENGVGWDHTGLLSLTNRVRAELAASKITPDNLAQLKDVLDKLFDEEQSVVAANNIELISITQTRLDKLLEDLIGMEKITADDEGLAAQALDLQNMWQQRFKTEYISIDDDRLEAMLSTGALRDLNLYIEVDSNSHIWKVDRVTPIGDNDLNIGQWWLNIECVYRDGVVDNTGERATIGKYGTTPVLPLLAGIETDGPTVGWYTYTREGPLEIMQFSLMKFSASKFRVLRGSELKSKYAPAAGVRYDGEYYLREWVHLPHESGDPTWRLELKLERVSGQASVNFLRNIPTPSQMDRSKICKEYEKQAVKETIEAGSTSSARRAEIVAPLAEILTDMAHPPPLDTRLLHPTGIGADATDEADPKDVGDTELRFEELFE